MAFYTIPTIKVTMQGVEGPVIINECDFDAKSHKKYVEPPKGRVPVAKDDDSGGEEAAKTE
jgi:hypothetical protein